jgi:hypothetical protein
MGGVAGLWRGSSACVEKFSMRTAACIAAVPCFGQPRNFSGERGLGTLELAAGGRCETIGA